MQDGAHLLALFGARHVVRLVILESAAEILIWRCMAHALRHMTASMAVVRLCCSKSIGARLTGRSNRDI
jgi:hypothetical protein